MERKIREELLKWYRDSDKKPLFLYGSRQIGKTYSCIEFGVNKYKNIAYFDCNNNIQLFDIFANTNSLDKVILKLQLYLNESIFERDTLLLFDNCYDPKFINLLKVFSKYDSKYDVIIISSKKDILNDIKGEEFKYLLMYPMDFEEFLINSDKKQLIDFIKDSYDTMKPMPFHQMAMDLYEDYLITGGLPEVVNAYFNNCPSSLIESLKSKILDIYKSDVSVHGDYLNIAKSYEVLDSLAEQLSKENRKFQYGVIRKGGRSKDYENCINILTTNSIVSRSYKLNDIKSPLRSNIDLDNFRLYANDCGLLYTMLHLNRNRLLQDLDIKRTLIENNTANMLNMLGYSLYYYQSDGKSNVTFVVQNKNGKIIPIEVQNMKSLKAKSLGMFQSKFNIEDSIRISMDNFSKKKNNKVIPCYAVFCLKDM